MSLKKTFLVFLLMTSPVIIDGGAQFLTNYLSNNIMRSITGLLGGFGIALLCYNLFRRREIEMERKLSAGFSLILVCSLLFNPVKLYAQEMKIVVLKAGTPVLLEIVETIDSEKANVGDIVKLKVIRPVKVDDIVVIKPGTRAEGKVAEVKKAKGWGVKGEIAMSLTNTYAVDDTEILLSATQRAIGEGKTGTATAVGVGTGLICLPFALTGFLIKGEQGKLLAGQEVKGYVDGDYKIKVSVK